MYSIYKNNNDQTFDDMTGPMGIGRITRLMSGWGVKFFDYDNDGNIDLFVVNGHPDDKIEQHSSHVLYKEPLLLFHNTGHRFENVSASAGPAFAQNLARDRKSTRLNSSHQIISYAVFCLKKKNTQTTRS